jgi:uncharacterized lipoprotein YddW (UPF0748 family)
MRIATILVLLALVASTSTFAQTVEPPKHEFRSAWVATAAGLDWPRGVTAAEQEASLRQLIRAMKAQNMNAVVFQVVPRGDAYYQSERLPWARRLSGQIGVDPGWDPLAVAIEEAHKHGMELHAWYNLGRMGDVGSADIGTASQPEPQHVYYANRDWLRTAQGNSNELWLQHADPDARQWALENVMEIVENYDVDAIHFDFVRYPTNGFEDDIFVWMDSPEFTEYANVADWRRDNINKFMRAVYDSIKAVKPLVKVGSTPVGHYATSGGWPALFGYQAVFSDSRRWLREGVHDYLAPQIYWDIGTSCNPRFDWIARDWMGERYDRHIYVGTGPYQCGPNGSSSLNVVGLPAQIDTLRAIGAHGNMHFRWRTVENTGYGQRYARQSIVPPMEWLDMTAPSTPTGGGFEWLATDTTWVRLEWQAPVAEGAIEARRYAIYKVRADAEPDFAEISADNMHLIALTGETTFYDKPRDANTYYFVTALSMNNVEGDPVVINLQGRATSSESEIAEGFGLDQNYPNPFNPSTTIQYSVERMSDVSLRVFNALGQEVARLVDGTVPPGTHSVRFDADHLPSGTYFYVLDAGGQSITRAMMLIK